MHRCAAIVVSAWLMAIGLSAPASGYVPPAPFLLELMLDHMNLPERMAVGQRLQVQPEEPGVPKTFDQRVRYRLPGAFRSDIETPELHQIRVHNGAASVTVLDGAVFSGRHKWHTCYKDLFLFTSRPALANHLAGFGVDMSLSSVGRLDKTLVYVLGALYPDETRGQVWIDKTTFRPVRWIVTPASGTQEPPVHEIRYLHWGSFDGTWYPGRVDFYEKGRRVQSIFVDTVTINPVFDGNIFNVSALRKRYSPADTGSSDETVTDGEIRRRLEEFKSIFEPGTQ